MQIKQNNKKVLHFIYFEVNDRQGWTFMKKIREKIKMFSQGNDLNFNSENREKKIIRTDMQ